MSVRRAAPKLLASRSVHLRIVPRPANLSESREMFRVLQRFGELSMYKSLRFEYHNPADNIALAIFRAPDAAQKALDASPIRFALEKVVDPNDADHLLELRSQDSTDDRETPPAKNGIDEILRPSTLSTRASPMTTPPRSPSTPSMPFAPPSPPQTRTKWFQVTVDRSRAVHQDFVERQPFWKQFQPMKSMAQEDLAKQVPHAGLSDVSKRPLSQHRTPVRVLKTMHEYVETRMPSLKGVVEGREAEERFARRRGV